MHSLMPTRFPGSNTHRIVHFNPDRANDFEKVEALVADGLAKLRRETKSLKEFPYDQPAELKKAIACIEDEVAKRRLLQPSLQDALRKVLEHLEQLDIPDQFDLLMWNLRQALFLSQRVCDLLAAEREVRRLRRGIK